MKPVTDEQVRLLRRKRMERRTQEAAAVAAGMSERSARNWETGRLPSEGKEPRKWRTREDPFEEVWATKIVSLLKEDSAGVLEATTILRELNKEQPEGEKLEEGQLRTLERRIREWRALHGPEKEVFFEQDHPPAREGAEPVKGFENPSSRI